MNILRKIYDWMGAKVYSKHATLWLATLFFIEAIFFIPVDPLLILYCVQNNKKSLYYALIATVASVAGGITGYLIGKIMWQTVGINLVKWIISETAFNAAILKYKLYQNWAVLIAGFTPLPYKAVTLSAGFCGLALTPFIVFSFISGEKLSLSVPQGCAWSMGRSRNYSIEPSPMILYFSPLFVFLLI